MMFRFIKYIGLTLIVWIAIANPDTSAQYRVQRGINETLKGVIYKKEWALEMTIHHNGFAIGYNTAKIRSFRKTKYYHVGIGYMKDGRQERQNKNFSQLGLSKSFSYGKQNMFFQIRVAQGSKHYFSEKYAKQGIALAYSYRLGPVLALLKPVYIDYLILEGEHEIYELQSIKYTDETKDDFMNYNRIYGGSGWTKGFGELRMIPGLHGNIALHFAMGAYSKYVRAMELGLIGDIYIKKIPIMVETDLINNKPYFLKLYVNLQMGVRSN